MRIITRGVQATISIPIIWWLGSPGPTPMRLLKKRWTW